MGAGVPARGHAVSEQCQQAHTAEATQADGPTQSPTFQDGSFLWLLCLRLDRGLHVSERVKPQHACLSLNPKEGTPETKV